MLAAFPFLPNPCPLMMIMQGDGKCFNVNSPSLWVSIHPKQHFFHVWAHFQDCLCGLENSMVLQLYIR